MYLLIYFQEQTDVFFPLRSHNIWRKIRSTELANQCGKDIEYSLKVRCLWSITFLSLKEIPDSFDHLSDNYSVPDKMKIYFEENHNPWKNEKNV